MTKMITCLVLTLSDSRTLATDTSGDYIVNSLQKGGYQVVSRRILPDEPDILASHLREIDQTSDIDVVILTGGTGLSTRDTTPEVVERLLAKKLDGFGELFRMKSFAQVGPFAMLSRAQAGVTKGGRVLFSLPGSTKAVQLGMDEIILPVIKHVVGLVRPS